MTNEDNNAPKEENLFITQKNAGRIRKLLTEKTYEQKHVIPDVIHKSELSDHAVDVLETFGLEAPATLNDYSCRVEDALIDACRRVKELKQELEDAQRQIYDYQLFKKQVLVSLGMQKEEPTTRTEYTDDKE